MKNIDQFSIYSAKIFDVLYESFPVPTRLNENDIISEYLIFNKHKELKDLTLEKDIAELADSPELADIVDREKISSKIISELKNEIWEIEKEENDDLNNQKSIFKGTLDFLVSEGLVLNQSPGSYRLTAKSFSHLSKTFEKGNIKSQDSSYISTIKRLLSKTALASEKVGIEMAVKVIPQFLGLS
jgi:hypothetical protein